MHDISITMYIETEEDKTEQISWIINEACTKIEQLKANVFYKMKDSQNREIKF